MQKASFARQYAMLRPVSGAGSGFVRIEGFHGRSRLTLRASCLPDMGVRALLLSGDEQTGAVLDLGLLTPLGRGQAGLCREQLDLLPGGYHTLALVADWPDGTMLMTGALWPSPSCSLWQVQEAVRHYLSVPAADSSRAESPPLAEPPSPAAKNPPVTGLPALQWPDGTAELRAYFDALPPSSPFEESGWRFVRVPLDSGEPASFCEVGIRIQGHRVVEAAYALPGQSDRPLPRPLEGYRWESGRHGQGYWVLRQAL